MMTTRAKLLLPALVAAALCLTLTGVPAAAGPPVSGTAVGGAAVAEGAPLAIPDREVEALNLEQLQRAESSLARVDGKDYDPGYIVSDEQFYDGRAMTALQVQSFLAERGSSCVAGEQPCLKDYRAETRAWSADAYCNGYRAGTQTAAEIIAGVGQSCGISQKALLVLLQKEQSLVTRTRPTSRAYQIATGYGCPDGQPCNEEYYGFFNQLYRAARQYKIYQSRPTSYNFQAGRTNTIPYNFNPACGSGPVFIQNEATRALYIYTPFQANAALLANVYGSGDSCSSFAQVHTWVFWSDWFGSPIGDSPAPRASFVDVATDNEFFTEIEWLAAAGISTGWATAAGQEFRPVAPVARDAMAAFLYRLAGKPPVTPPAESPFVDVATTNQFYKEIAWLYDSGISTGWATAAGREFRPLAPIARDAMAAFMYRFAGSPAYSAPATSPFRDVPTQVLFYREISWLAQRGISTGWSGAQGAEFRPLSSTNRDAMAAFMYRLSRL